MEKRGQNGNLSDEEIVLLRHLIESLENSKQRLQDYYNKKDSEGFNNVKKLMISISKKISEVIK